MTSETKDYWCPLPNHGHHPEPECPKCQQVTDRLANERITRATSAPLTSKEQLYQEAFGLLRRAQYLLQEACAKHKRAVAAGSGDETPVAQFASRLRKRIREMQDALGGGSHGVQSSMERSYVNPHLEGVLDAIDELEGSPEETTPKGLECGDCGSHCIVEVEVVQIDTPLKAKGPPDLVEVMVGGAKLTVAVEAPAKSPTVPNCEPGCDCDLCHRPAVKASAPPQCANSPDGWHHWTGQGTSQGMCLHCKAPHPSNQRIGEEHGISWYRGPTVNGSVSNSGD